MTAGVPDAEGAGDTVTVGGFVRLHAPPGVYSHTAVPPPDEVPIVEFVTVNCVGDTVAITMFGMLRDVPFTVLSPVTEPVWPLVKLFAAVYVIVPLLPAAAVTDAINAGGIVMLVIVPLVIEAVAVAVTPPTPVGASSVTVGAVAAV